MWEPGVGPFNVPPGGGTSGALVQGPGDAIADEEVTRGDSSGLQGSNVYITDGASPLVQIGGRTSSFPALLRAGAVLVIRLADDSADAALRAAQLAIDNLLLDGNTISTVNANGDLVLAPNGTGSIVIPSAGGMTTPAVRFAGETNGIGGTPAGLGWVLDATNYVNFRTNAVVVRGPASAEAGLLAAAASATAPNLLPNAISDTNTGIGSAGADQLSLIAGGVEIGRLTEGLAGVSDGLAATRPVEASTAGSGAPNVLVAEESRTLLTNEGATAEAYNTLPTALAGREHSFNAIDSDGIRVVAAAGDEIEIGGVVSAVAGFIRLAANAKVHLVALNATRWSAQSSAGTP